jgi:predicted DNA binding CopG/RHH family protein
MSDHDKRSTDAELAAELGAAMADPSEWGDAIPDPRSGRSEKRQRAAMISIRLSAEELRTVQGRAADRGLSVSQYVRDLVLQPTRQPSRASTYTLTVSVNSRDTAARNVTVSTAGPAVAPPYLLVGEAS